MRELLEEAEDERENAVRWIEYLMMINKSLGLPMIIIAYVNSVLIAGGSQYMESNALNITTCMLAMISGILQSALTFLKVPERLTENTKVCLGLDSLISKIKVMSKLPPECRQVAPGKFARDCADELQHLQSRGEIRRARCMTVSSEKTKRAAT